MFHLAAIRIFFQFEEIFATLVLIALSLDLRNSVTNVN